MSTQLHSSLTPYSESFNKPFPAHKYIQERLFQEDDNAKVALMRHTKKDRCYVVKIIEEKNIGRYVQGVSFEAHMGMRVLNHEGFAKTYKFYTLSDKHYLLIEYIEGKLLKTVEEEWTGHPLAEQDFKTLMRSYFEAMHYLIDVQIFPKGIHERNILIRGDFTIKIIDFERYLENAGHLCLDMGHIILRYIRPLLCKVRAAQFALFDEWEDALESYADADGFDELSAWAQKVLDHPFLNKKV